MLASNCLEITTNLKTLKASLNIANDLEKKKSKLDFN